MAAPEKKHFALFAARPPRPAPAAAAPPSAVPSPPSSDLVLPPLDPTPVLKARVPEATTSTRAAAPKSPKKAADKGKQRAKRAMSVSSSEEDAGDAPRAKSAKGKGKGRAEGQGSLGGAGVKGKKVRAGEEVQLSGSPKRIKKAKDVKGKSTRMEVESDDDEVIVVKSKASSSSLFGTSSRSSSAVLVIPDSPELKSTARATVSSFMPLSDLHRASREKRKAREPVEPRWPTQDEHGGDSMVVHRALGAERWVSAEGKGKGKKKDEEQGFFSTLTTTTIGGHATAASIPTGDMQDPPRLAYHSTAEIQALCPPFTSHPLLDRLARPLQSPELFPFAFLRPHDREQEAYKVESKSWSQLWTTKYAPTSAAEILGVVSGKSTAILRDWLEELAISSASDLEADRSKKRRPVVRTAAKPSKKKKRRDDDDSDLDDFIAPEDDDDEVSAEDSDDPDGAFRPTAARRSIFPFLSNLILLHGPTGSGKTSAVHTIATELGWDVFEVYPGMGKRRAKDVERYVGDVGKNHLVRAGTSVGGSSGKDPFAMFRKEPVKVDDTAAAVHPTQSLILFDEVDVLYHSEKDFWTGLVQLVSSSRRPVIMTCSDLSLIPFDILGLQTIVQFDISSQYLPFAPPELSTAVSYLQLVSLSEGHIVSPSVISSLYTTSNTSISPPYLTEGPSDPLPHPAPSEAVTVPNLRQALSQLQFECQWAVGDTMGGVGWMDFSAEKAFRTAWSEGTCRAPVADEVGGEAGGSKTLEKSQISAEAMSFLDAFVTRPSTISNIDDPPPLASKGVDEIIAYWIPLEPLIDHDPQQLCCHRQDQVIASTLQDLASTIDATCISDSYDSLILQSQTKAVRIAHLLTYNAGLLEPPSSLVPHPSIFTDVLPYIRSITTADDLHAVAFNPDDGVVASTGRRATRSKARSYEGRFDWTVEEGKMVREGRFVEG